MPSLIIRSSVIRGWSQLYFHAIMVKFMCVVLFIWVCVCLASSIMTLTHVQGIHVPLTDGVFGIPHAVHLHRVGGDATPAHHARVARYHLHLHQCH